MPGRIGADKHELIITGPVEPVEIPANYIPGFEKDECIAECFPQFVYIGKYAGLYTLCITYTVGYLNVFYLYLTLLFDYFPGPGFKFCLEI